MSTPVPQSLQMIPERILSKIFQFTAATSPVTVPMQPFGAVQHTLLSVCRMWHAVAVSTPSIWDYIMFEAVLTPSLTTTELLRQFSLCLERSNNNLVTIEFSENAVGWDFRSVNSVLKLCYSRTMSLTCTLSSRLDMDTFLSLPPRIFPALQYINIDFVNNSADIEYTSSRSHPTRVFEGASSLKVAVLHHLPGLNHVRLRLPWTQLTDLDLGGTPMPPTTFIRIMKYASRTLQTAFIFVEVNGPLDTALMGVSNAIYMQNLTTLRLRLAYPNRDWRVLSLLRIPGLVTLRLEMFDALQIWSFSHIAQLLRPSSEYLRRLHLSDFRYSGHPIVRAHQETTHTALYHLLNLLPKIKTLILPISTLVHVATIDSIASGEILKNISVIEFPYANILHGISLVRRRGALAQMSLCGEGHSTAGGLAVSSLDLLSMWVPSHQCNMEEVSEINAERERLISEGFTCHIYIHPTTNLPLPLSSRV